MSTETEVPLLKGEGEVRITKERCYRRICGQCDEPATHRLSFLLDGARRNPASKAYGRDDCSWCSDEDRYSCKSHVEDVRRAPPEGMGWCSTFDCVKLYPHMLLYWQKVSA